MPYQVNQTWSFTFFIIYSTGYELITVMWASNPTPFFGYPHGSHNTIVPVNTPRLQVSVVVHLGHSRIRSRVSFLPGNFHDTLDFTNLIQQGGSLQLNPSLISQYLPVKVCGVCSSKVSPSILYGLVEASVDIGVSKASLTNSS